MDIGDDLDGFRHSPVGRWVECMWNFDANQGSPHPDAAETIAKICPHSVSAMCVGVEEPYVVLAVRDTQIRVKPFSIRIRATSPKFKHGDTVRTIPSSSVKTELVAPIRTPDWHVKNQEWTYYLETRGKRRRRMYREADLELVSRWSR